MNNQRLGRMAILSLLLHALVLYWIAQAMRHTAPSMPFTPTVQVRLASGKAPAAPESPPQQDKSAALPTPAARGTAPHPPAAEAPASAFQERPAPTPEELAVVPSGFGSAPPASADLQFESRSASGNVEGEASLSWRFADRKYTLRLAIGTRVLQSEGVQADTGMSPLSASEEDSAGRRASRFDRKAGKLSFSNSERTFDVWETVQDPASVIMQLAALGNSDPTALDSDIAFAVSGDRELAVIHFVPLGEEQLDTPLGKLTARRFLQVGGSGAGQFEVWLGPAQHWLPVQMRTTYANGSSLTQVIKRLDMAPSK